MQPFSSNMAILPCRDPALLGRLVPLATSEGFEHLGRLVAEWAEGINRFEEQGETLLMVVVDHETVACGGITRQGNALGRVRRMYVDPEFRRRGIGRVLVAALIEKAGTSFDELVLYTDNRSAAQLYEQLGFVPEEPTSTPDCATHRLDLRGKALVV